MFIAAKYHLLTDSPQGAANILAIYQMENTALAAKFFEDSRSAQGPSFGAGYLDAQLLGDLQIDGLEDGSINSAHAREAAAALKNLIAFASKARS